MYEHVGNVDTEVSTFLLDLANQAQWKYVVGDGRNYRTSYVTGKIEHLLPQWEKWHEGFFLMIPAAGRVHRHRDVLHLWKTYHIPVQTNPGCHSYAYSDQCHDFHLEVGGIYRIDRSIEHASVNLGDTDRIHLLAEVYE